MLPSDINHIFPVISDNSEAFVCNLDTLILRSFSYLSTFSRVLGLFWPVRATPDVAREQVYVGACDFAACAKLSGEAAERESSLFFSLLVRVTQR